MAVTRKPDPAADLPAVLLPYQQRLVAAVETDSVVVVEKSRRTGFSWVAAAIAALLAARSRAAGGMDVMYMGYEREMTREFIGYVADWAKEFQLAARPVEEFVFTDPDKPDAGVGAFRVKFASGFEVTALPSMARAVRGKQGLAILDEAAFMDDLSGVLKAALAYLMWGGKVLVLSTHLGEDNAFNGLVQDIRGGRLPYTLQRCTFDEALAEGLFKRICLRTGKTWSPETEAAFRADILAKYRGNADEELFCIPASGGAAPIPGSLVTARMSPAPVLRWKCDAGFLHLPEAERRDAVDAFCRLELAPVLDRLDRARPHAMGMDFARRRDLSVLWPVTIAADTSRHTPFVLELRNVPFEAQRDILFFVANRLPRLRAVALDEGGNGMYLAEQAVLKYGERALSISLTEPWYRENMPPLKAAFEDGTFSVPRDQDIADDFRLLRWERGVIRVPARRLDSDGEGRHGDAAIAAALALFAAKAEPSEYGYRAQVAGLEGYQAQLDARAEAARDAMLGDRHGGFVRALSKGALI
jgi:phage FluMu gp28-like protein